jgi:hypothetical protein
MLMDLPYYAERKLALLKWLCSRWSIKREDWHELYCYNVKIKAAIPKKKQDRLAMPDLVKAEDNIKATSNYLVIGLGKHSCEFLTGASLLNSRVGGCWNTKKFGEVWITYSPDAALYDPNLVVPIFGVIGMAAEEAGIKVKADPKVPMFTWEEYEFKHR